MCVFLLIPVSNNRDNEHGSDTAHHLPFEVQPLRDDAQILPNRK